MVRSLFGTAMLLMSTSCAEPIVCTTGECEETGMVQRINRRARSQTAQFSGSGPVAELLQAAKKMLREGTTPAVLIFTNDTLKDIRDQIIPKILENHKHDQELLDKQVKELEEIIADYKEDLKAVAKNEHNEEIASVTHKKCRGHANNATGSEAALCLDASEKNWRRAVKWAALLKGERVYVHYAETLHGRFCPPKHPTWHSKNLKEKDINPMVPDLVTYRRFTRNTMMKFNEKGSIYFRILIVEWEEADRNASKANASHKVKRMECNSYKRVLEQKSCARATHHAETIAQFEEEFHDAEVIFNKTKENVVISEADRVREFVTLHMVECLLKKIEARNGTRCDESTDKEGEIIDNCETKDVDTIHLEIDYPCAPPKPPHGPIKCYPGTPVCYREEYYKIIEDHGFCFSDQAVDRVHNNFPLPAIHNQNCTIADVSMYY